MQAATFLPANHHLIILEDPTTLVQDMQTPNTTNLFTCTFCYQLSNGPVRVLGRSARLACTACYNGIIDLSIY
jgi:hypothetical protein